MTRRLGPGLGGRPAIVGHGDAGPAVDEDEPPVGRAVAVVAVAGRQRVVDDRDAGSSWSSPSRTNERRSFHALPLQPAYARACNTSMTADGSITTSYRPAGSSTGSAEALALAAAHGAQRRAVEARPPTRRVAGDPVGALVAGDAGHPALGRLAGEDLPGGADERAGPVVRADVPGRLELAGGVDERPHDLRPVRRCGRGRGRIEGRGRRGCRHRCEAGPAGVERRDADGVEDALDEGGHAGFVDDRRRPRRRPALPVQAQPHRGDVLGDVLVDHGVGEPGQGQAVAVGRGVDLGVGRRRCRELDRDRRQPLLGAGGHARTPTRTLRNRAGAEGWPVWPTWPGWPLPQLGVPHATVSDESMSIEDQNRGPMPV